MKKAYILSTPKQWIKDFFKEGTWSKEDMTSIIIRKEDGKLIQVFGSGSQGDYDYFKDKVIELVSYNTGRTFGYGKMIGYSSELVKGARTYVFK